ncbi:hypothetical protein E4T56_gene17811 [Termitomyces sp. T112]|nr:hypothetical protein E4T56_gene17811 [Termitomyces sp. T112]
MPFSDYLDGWEILKKMRKGFAFMRGLIKDMTNSDSRKRPFMSDVVSRFEDIIKKLDDQQLRSPVLNVDEDFHIFGKVKHWTRNDYTGSKVFLLYPMLDMWVYLSAYLYD